MIRLKKEYSFLIKIEGLNDIPKSGILQVGGEGKTAVYEELNINPVENLDSIEFELKNNMFKIYLATPSIFNKGWIPDWIDENNLQGEKDGIKLKLIACVIGKYLRIGGWDMANNCPKQMRKAVPSGSVYYFKVLNNVDSEKIKEVFHLKNISEINSEEGFGLSLIGVV
jgi:CRISPR-associated protein Cmr3